jgi:DNA polymerase-3 subunit epsilon
MKTQEELMEERLAKRTVDRDKAISDARWILMLPYFVLDTETTGLKNAQMCQIAIRYNDGSDFKSLVKPTIPIEKGASDIHHITDKDVEDAPSALDVIKKLPIFGTMVIYNAPFDVAVLKESVSAMQGIYTIEYNNDVYDAMQIYSAFKGDWDDYHGNYKWHKLGNACEQCGIKLDLELHDALSDAIMTERLIKYIASQKLSTET